MVPAGSGAAVSFPCTARCTAATLAPPIGFWPTTATGAVSHRPTHGTGWTRTPAPSFACSSANNGCAPANSQLIESHTRTVSRGGGVSPSFTTSKWW